MSFISDKYAETLRKEQAMNEFLILYTLLKSNANIYEIKKFLNANFSPFLELSTGALIPALNRLESKNCVAAEKFMTEGGMRRSIYHITDEGRAEIVKYLSSEIDCAPQLMRRETEVLLLALADDVFDETQKELLTKKIKFALEKQTTLLKNAIAGSTLNLEFLNTELVYTEAKLRMLSGTSNKDL